jgi:riboflavin synthase
MFSGITVGLFKVVYVSKSNSFMDYAVCLSEALVDNLKIGASVAIDGVCQTVVKIDGLNVSFQAINETLEKTTLQDLCVGAFVSVERSLKVGDEIGGHEVSGHVFGVGEITQVLETHNSITMVIHCDPFWMQYIFPKGYIVVDGSSLTVGDIDIKKGLFTIHLIPETLRVTNFKNKKVHNKVNLEFDYKTKIIVDTVKDVLSRSKSYA